MKKKCLTIFGLIIIGIITLYFRTDLFYPPIEVETFRVERKNLPIIISTTGNLMFTNKIEITPKFSGRVLDIKVKTGDKVKKGDILVILDAKDIEKQMKNIKTMIETLKAQETLQKQMGILGGLFGFYSQSATQSNISFESIKNLLESYYQNLKDLYESRIIKSEIDGIVVNVNIDKGQMIKREDSSGLNLQNLTSLNLSSLLNLFAPSTSSIITIVDINSLVAVVRVDESNVLKLKEGQDAEVKVEALGDKWWKGKVKNISFSPSLNREGTYSYEVKISIPSLGDKVREGMSISANIYVGKKENALIIPLKSIYFEGGKTYVFTVKNNHALQKEIILGDIYQDMVEVKNGLYERDIVITSPLNKIKNGIKVRLKNGDLGRS
jgi:HlyD family secretion protein